jgi:hypothetical protein
MDWELNFRSGVFPIVEVYTYNPKGKHYEIVYTFAYDEHGNKQQIGDILLITHASSKKTRRFRTLEKLNEFLRKRGIPPFYPK